MENRLRNSQFRSTNSFYASKSGFITTFTQGSEEDDIRKSRIEHLPSHKKVDLSGKLQFVVVFQTIEIERLSLQIQSLRVMLKDADRQIHNYLNYEVQIKELTQNCHQLEEQRINYQNQIEQMSLACNSLYEQLSECKKQYDLEIEDLKKEFLNHKNALLRENETLKDTIARLEKELRNKNESEKEVQNKLKTVSQQLVRLNQNLYQTQAENNSLKEKEGKKNEQLNRLQQEVKAWQNTLKDERQQKEQRLQKDRREKDSLINRIEGELQKERKEKESIVNNWQRERKQREVAINKLENQKQKVGGQIQRKKSEIQGLKKDWSKMLDKAQNQLVSAKQENQSLKRTAQQQCSNLTNQLNQSLKSNQDLSNQLKGALQSISKEKKKSSQLDGLLSDLKNRIQTKCKQVQGFKNYINEYARQWQAKQKRERQLVQKVTSLEPVLAQNQKLQENIYELKCIINEKDQELSAKNEQIGDLNIYIKQVSYNMEQLTNTCKRNQSQLQQLEEKLQRQRKNGQQQKKRLTSDFQRALEKEGEQKRTVINQKDQLVKEIEKLKMEGLIKEQMKNQIKRLLEKCKKQEKDFQSMKERFEKIHQLLKKLAEKCSAFTEVEKTNALLKKQLDSSLALTDKMIKKIGELWQENENLVDENWKLRDQLREENFKDDFSTANSNKTITSTPSMSNSLRFSGVQPKAFESAIRRVEKSPTGVSSNSGYSTERLNFNNEVNIARYKPKPAQEQTSNKRILQPSTYYPSRESNYTSSIYSSVAGPMSSRDSGYGLQRRQRK